MDKQTEYVLRTIEERDIRFIRLWFTDVPRDPEVGVDRPPSLRARSPKGSVRRFGHRGFLSADRVRHAGQARPLEFPDPALAR